MRYYKINETMLHTLLRDSIELSYLNEGGVDNWQWYGESIGDGINEWIDEHHDIVNTWDDDDPRHEDFFIDDIAQIEIDIYYKKYLLGEDKND